MAFARLFAARRQWEPTAKFSTFLWRIALNLCHDESRRSQRRREFSLEALEEDGVGGADSMETDGPSPDAQAEASERGELVRRALRKLAPHYREVVALRHYEGLKFREIGNVLGIPEGTAKSRMAEALEQLNRLLKHVNEGESCKNKTPIPEALAL
jgi:RNA polymerase sigma-70 factor (ECF subfamily)